MTQRQDEDRTHYDSEDTGRGLKGADVLALLAVSALLAAIGLLTFTLTTAFG